MAQEEEEQEGEQRGQHFRVQGDGGAGGETGGRGKRRETGAYASPLRFWAQMCLIMCSRSSMSAGIFRPAIAARLRTVTTLIISVKDKVAEEMQDNKE